MNEVVSSHFSIDYVCFALL